MRFLVVLCSFSCILFAETPDPAEPWIRQLGSPSYHAREEASLKLRQMSYGARESLREAVRTHGKASEVGLRAQAILKDFVCTTDWSRVRTQFESHVDKLSERRETDDFLKKIVSRLDGQGEKAVLKAVMDAGGDLVQQSEIDPRAVDFDRYRWRIDYEKKRYLVSLDARGRIFVRPETFEAERLQFRFHSPDRGETWLGSMNIEGRALPVSFGVEYDPQTDRRTVRMPNLVGGIRSVGEGFYDAAWANWRIPLEDRDAFFRSKSCEGY